MNKNRDYYYKILGLRPGATPSEIKSAYRRLVKFYHPDRDQSADSETMYREIYTAYKTLSEKLSASETGTGQVVYRYHPEEATETLNQAKKTHQSTAESNNSSKWSAETSNQAKKTSQSNAGSNNSSKWSESDSKEYNDWVYKVSWDSESWEYYEKIPFELRKFLYNSRFFLKKIFIEYNLAILLIPMFFFALFCFCIFCIEF